MARYETLPVDWESTGGRLCLDFSNTMYGHGREHECDRLGDYAALVAWGGRAGLLTEEEERYLLQRARADPRAADSVYRQATQLRDAIYTVFSAITGGRQPDPEALEIINRALSDALGNLRVVQTEDGFTWGCCDRDNALEYVLWPVARSAGELLTETELSRVRQCADSECTWLFLDTSKNRSRRWCVMEVCGNRAKGRRHYAKRRASRAGADSHDR